MVLEGKVGLKTAQIISTVSQAKAYPLSAKLDTCPNQSKNGRQSIGNGKGCPQPGQTEYSGKNQQAWQSKDKGGRSKHQRREPSADPLKEETQDPLDSYSKEKQGKYPKSWGSFKEELRVSVED